MNKQDWISAKIAKLINEGRPKEQAVAIAYSMYENHMQEGGEIPAYQFGGSFIPQPINMPQAYAPQLNPLMANQYANFSQQLEEKYPVSPQAIQPINYTPQVTAASSLQAKPLNTRPTTQIVAPSATNIENEIEEDKKRIPAEQTQYDDWVKYNILDPNKGGMDLGTSLAYTGQQFGQGNTGMGAMGAGLTALKGVRSFLTGYASGKGQKTLEQQMRDKLYNREDKYTIAQEGIGEVEDEDYLYSDMINKYPNAGQPLPKPAPTDDFLGGASPTATSPEGVPYQSNPNFVPTTVDKVDTKSARDIWVEKTGLPWSEAKRRGYTDGTAKDNIKLLGELNDPRFKAENLRSKPFTSPTQQKQQAQAAVVEEKANAAAQAAKIKTYQNYMDSPEYKALPKRGAQNQGQIRQVEDASILDKLKQFTEYAAHPLQTFGEYAKYSELPAAGFSKYSENPFDAVLGTKNPAYWLSKANNAVDFAAQEEYKKAAIEALGVLPAAQRIKWIQNIPMLAELGQGKGVVPKALGQGAQRLGQGAPKMLKDAGQGVQNYISGSYRPFQQGGYTVGQEYDMDEDEIQNLIQQGYKIRYV